MDNKESLPVNNKSVALCTECRHDCTALDAYFDNSFTAFAEEFMTFRTNNGYSSKLGTKFHKGTFVCLVYVVLSQFFTCKISTDHGRPIDRESLLLNYFVRSPLEN